MNSGLAGSSQLSHTFKLARANATGVAYKLKFFHIFRAASENHFKKIFMSKKKKLITNYE